MVGEFAGGGQSLRHFLAAAELARRGNQRGAKHGCLLVVDDEQCGGHWRVLGEGWNHEVVEQRSAAGLGRPLPLHLG